MQAGRQAVYDADLKSYFDTISHEKLLACLRHRVTDRSVLGLIRMWLEAVVGEPGEDGTGGKVTRNEKGTPQGGVISPLLANLFLHWFDALFHGPQGPSRWADAKLVRYADDMVILAREWTGELTEWVESRLEGKFGLEINREKTRVVEVKAGSTCAAWGEINDAGITAPGNGWPVYGLAAVTPRLERFPPRTSGAGTVPNCVW